MSIALEYIKTSDHLVVKFVGKWTTTEAFKSIEDIKEVADELEMKRILFDLQGLSIPDNEMTRFYSGEKLASTFGARYKIAGFSQGEKINRFAETVSINRGANFKMFDAQANALNWLLH